MNLFCTEVRARASAGLTVHPLPHGTPHRLAWRYTAVHFWTEGGAHCRLRLSWTC